MQAPVLDENGNPVAAPQYDQFGNLVDTTGQLGTYQGYGPLDPQQDQTVPDGYGETRAIELETPQAFTPPSSGGGGGGYGGGSLIDPFTQQFQPPPHQNWQDYIPQTPTYTAPVFRPPTYTPPEAWSYRDFEGPNAETVLSRPGYQFRLDQGQQALQNAKAAQGIYGTGATLKAILGYGQDYASNEFQNEWNRGLGEYQTNRGNSLDAYNTNYQTQYSDPYKFAYQGALDSFAPQMAEFNANVGIGNTAYQTQAAAGQRQNEFDYNNAWSQYLFDYDKFRDQRDSTFNKQWEVTQA